MKGRGFESLRDCPEGLYMQCGPVELSWPSYQVSARLVRFISTECIADVCLLCIW